MNGINENAENVRTTINGENATVNTNTTESAPLTANEKGKITLAITAYLKAKEAEKRAHSEAAERQAELLAFMNGDTKREWEDSEGRLYKLTATYGKTRKSLNKELTEKVLGVTITDECYAVSKPWDELKVTIA